MTEVIFDRPTRFESLGRNGYLATTGLFLSLIDNEVFIEPRTSRNVPGRCRIVVPLDKIDDVIKGLTSFRRLRRLDNETSIDVFHLKKLNHWCLRVVAVNSWSILTPAAQQFLLNHPSTDVSSWAAQEHNRSMPAKAA